MRGELPLAVLDGLCSLSLDAVHRHSMKDIREEVMQRKVSAVREEDVLPVSKSLQEEDGAPESKTLGNPLGLRQRKRASPRGEAKDSALLPSCDADILVPPEWPQGPFWY